MGESRHGRGGSTYVHEGHKDVVSYTNRRTLILGLLLVVGYIVVRQIAGLLGDPGLALPPPQEREPFRVDMALPDLQGTRLRLAALRGRPVLLNFWATWCLPCREEMPSLQALHEAYASRGLALIAIASDEGGAAVVAPFLQAQRLTLPVLLDPQSVVGTQLQLPGIPATYLLDKHGRIAGFAKGARNWHTPSIHHLIDQLLAEEG